MKDDIIKINEKYRKIILVFPSCGVDVKLFKIKRNECKKYINVGFVSNLIEPKGIYEYLESIVILSKKLPIRGMIIGDGIERTKVRKWIKEKMLKEYFILLAP